MDEEDRRIETHPDLIDPNWQKHAEVDAWLGAKKELKKKRRKQRKAAGASGGGYREPGSARWPGIAAIVGLVVLIVLAVTVNQLQDHGVNETPWFPFDETQISQMGTNA